MNQYYYRKKGVEKPPISLEELIEKIGKGKIKPKTEIRIGETGEWQKAKHIKMLKPYFDMIAKNQSKSNSQSFSIDFEKYFEIAKRLLNQYWYIPLLFIALLFIKNCEMPRIFDKTPPPPVEDCNFSKEKKTEIINDNLQFAFDKPGVTCFDGDVEIRIVNLSRELTFRLNQIGMQTVDASDENLKYNNPRVNLLIKPLEEKTIEVSFPSFRKSQGRPYALLDAARIICED